MTLAASPPSPPAPSREKDPNRPDLAKLRRQKKRQKRKRKRQEKRAEEEAAASPTPEVPRAKKQRTAKAKATPTPAEPEPVRYAFEVDDADHCESPTLAYRHVCPFLDEVAARLGKDRASLRIYDPYYCEGGVKRRLGGLGFAQVRNDNEDFYARLAAEGLPPLDVLVTNPPYSEDHIDRLLDAVMQLPSGTWYALLLPNFVYHKYEGHAVFQTPAMAPFFLCPKRRYEYVTVKGRHQQKSATKTAPFVSMWYLGCARPADEGEAAATDARKSAVAALRDRLAQRGPAVAEAAVAEGESTSKATETWSGIRLAKSVQALPNDVLDHNDPRTKRLRNAKKRKKNKARKKE